MDQSDRSVGVDYWRASEASETLIGLNNGNRRYIYVCIYIYMVRARHFSSAARCYIKWEELRVSHSKT